MKATRLGAAGLAAALLGALVAATPASAAPDAADAASHHHLRHRPGHARSGSSGPCGSPRWSTSTGPARRPRPPRTGRRPAGRVPRAGSTWPSSCNHNAVFVQVRPTADAFWPSPYEPWSEWLTGRPAAQDPGWDPLAFLVDEAHARNLEFHAWFNPYRVAMPAPGGAGADLDSSRPTTRPAQHPDWAVAYPPAGAPAAGSTTTRASPRSASFVEDAMLDAVKRYDIDGVHFDDYFYPYPAAGQASRRRHLRRSTAGGFTDRADWRRDNVNLLVQEMHGKHQGGQAVGEVRHQPVRHLAQQDAPTRSARDTTGMPVLRRHLRRHPQVGASEGWIDYIVPQLYWNIGVRRPPTTPSWCPGGPTSVARHRRAALHRPGRLQERRPGAAGRLAGPARAVRPPHAQPAVPGGAGQRALLAPCRCGPTGSAPPTSTPPSTTPARRWCRPCRTCRPSRCCSRWSPRPPRQADGVRLTWRQPADGVGPARQGHLVRGLPVRRDQPGRPVRLRRRGAPGRHGPGRRRQRYAVLGGHHRRGRPALHVPRDRAGPAGQREPRQPAGLRRADRHRMPRAPPRARGIRLFRRMSPNTLATRIPPS